MKLYHWTKKVNLPSIYQRGLIGWYHSNSDGKETGIVYLTPEPYKWKAKEYVKEDDVCLEVETGDLKLTAFDDCLDWEVLCWGNIPPENIKEMRLVKETEG